MVYFETSAETGEGIKEAFDALMAGEIGEGEDEIPEEGGSDDEE